VKNIIISLGDKMDEGGGGGGWLGWGGCSMGGEEGAKQKGNAVFQSLVDLPAIV